MHWMEMLNTKDPQDIIENAIASTGQLFDDDKIVGTKWRVGSGDWGLPSGRVEVPVATVEIDLDGSREQLCAALEFDRSTGEPYLASWIDGQGAKGQGQRDFYLLDEPIDTLGVMARVARMTGAFNLPIEKAYEAMEYLLSRKPILEPIG